MKRLFFYSLLLVCATSVAIAAPTKLGANKGKCRASGDTSFFRDEGLATKVAAKLQFNRLLMREQVDVKASGGVVTLSGNVTSHDRISLAAKIAGDVSGVRCVINLLKVGPSLKPPVSPAKDSAAK